MLSPLNTSMFPVALPDLQREFSTSAKASTWLLTVFALVSAVGHPLAGYLADRLGARRVLVVGLVVTGLSALVAACGLGGCGSVGVGTIWSATCLHWFRTRRRDQASHQTNHRRSIAVAIKLRYITPLLAAAAAAAIATAPAGADPAQPACTALGGSATQCQTPGNVQINVSPPPPHYSMPYKNRYSGVLPQ
jgi:MFS family permease